MRIRRAFFVWQFAAAAVLPLWVLVGWAVWGVGTAGFLGVALLAPVLMATELVLAGLLSARGSVRRARALGWPEIAAISAFHGFVIGAGFYGPASSWLAVLAVVAALVVFWLGVSEFVSDVRRRMRETLAAFGAPTQRPSTQRRPQQRPSGPINGGEYIVLPRSTPGASPR